MNILKINGQALEGIYVDAAISFNKPAKRVSTYSVPGRNGDLVIDEGTFDNVLITYPVFEKSTFPTEFDAIVNYLASLEGYQRIECSNDPQHFRLGRFVVPQTPTVKRLNRDGYYQLSFDCKPQRWLLSGEEDTEIDANPIDEYSGDIVSIDAVTLDEITELKAAIEPVQNLNGQTSPYPAGGGVNLLSSAAAETQTSNGVTFVSDGKGKYTLSETATAAASVSFSIAEVTLPSSAIYVHLRNATANANISIFFAYNGTNVAGITLGQANRIYQLANLSGATINTIHIAVPNGVATNLSFTPSLELTNSITDFAPYSNICPISGHTEVNVYRTGKNLFSTTWEQGVWDSSGVKVNSSAYVRMADKVPVISGVHYAFHRSVTTGYWQVRGFGANGEFIGTGSDTLTLISGGGAGATAANPMRVGADSCVVEFKEGIKYFTLNNTSNDTSTKCTMVFGDTPLTTYEPYAGQTYPISLGQTVYGGTLNVTTGVLTITHERLNMGSFTYGYSAPYFYTSVTTKAAGNFNIMADSYKTATQGAASLMGNNEIKGNATTYSIYVTDSRYTDPAAFKTAVNGIYMVFELATPTTVQLTAAEVELLLGQNNIWADTGDVEVKVTSPAVFNNPSPFNSKPLIRVYGIGTFRVNDITVTIASHDKPYIDIDCELQECFYEDTNMNEYVSFSGNDFPELQPGNNYMLLASGITKLIVTPRWWIL